MVFEKGHSGGPGRPKGSRNKLAESFLKALADDFEARGVAAIVKVREADPSTYLKVIASLLPKEIDLEVAQSFVVETPMPIEDIEEWAKLNGSGQTIKH